MRRKKVVSMRLDIYNEAKIEELSEILRVNRSVILRVLITHSLNLLQDETGRWKLPRQIYEQQKTIDEESEQDDGDTDG